MARTVDEQAGTAVAHGATRAPSRADATAGATANARAVSGPRRLALVASLVFACVGAVAGVLVIVRGAIDATDSRPAPASERALASRAGAATAGATSRVPHPFSVTLGGHGLGDPATGVGGPPATTPAPVTGGSGDLSTGGAATDPAAGTDDQGVPTIPAGATDGTRGSGTTPTGGTTPTPAPTGSGSTGTGTGTGTGNGTGTTPAPGTTITVPGTGAGSGSGAGNIVPPVQVPATPATPQVTVPSIPVTPAITVTVPPVVSVTVPPITTPQVTVGPVDTGAVLGGVVGTVGGVTGTVTGTLGSITRPLLAGPAHGSSGSVAAPNG